METLLSAALEQIPPGDDPRRQLLAVELEAVVKELDAAPTARPPLIAALERLTDAVFPAGARLAGEEMDLDAWWAAMGGRR